MIDKRGKTVHMFEAHTLSDLTGHITECCSPLCEATSQLMARVPSVKRPVCPRRPVTPRIDRLHIFRELTGTLFLGEWWTGMTTFGQGTVL
jgi:hypothetical protein